MAFADDLTPCCSKECPSSQCEPEERLVRCIIHGVHKDPLTTEQREWLIKEAEWAGEGAYPAEEARGLTDVDLANRTLNAWQDYVNTHY